MTEPHRPERRGEDAAPPGWGARYVALLGVEHPAPTLEALRRLVRAQVLRVPFENATAVLRRREAGTGLVPPLDTEALLAAWESRAAGGVCFEHAEMFGRLLAVLGYDVTPIAGEISFPSSHQALMVRLGDARWLVDVGNGAPFFEPIPLDREHEIRRAGLSYRFRADPDDAEVWLQERGIDGRWSPFCRYRLRPQSEPDRAAAYQRHHRSGETWVTAALVLVRSGEDEVLAFRDGELTRFTAQGKTTERIEDLAAWERLPSLFGVPALPVLEAARAWALANRRPGPGARAG
jgi:arylamine N-acetyltransferase